MTKIAKITQAGPGYQTPQQRINGKSQQRSPSPHAPQDVHIVVRQAQNGVFLVRGPNGEIVTCTNAMELGNTVRAFFDLPPEGIVKEPDEPEPKRSKGKRKERYEAPSDFGVGDQMIVEGASWLFNKAQQGSRSGMGSMAGLTKRMKGTARRKRKKK